MGNEADVICDIVLVPENGAATAVRRERQMLRTVIRSSTLEVPRGNHCGLSSLAKPA
jgi:hypothetical protein